MASEVLHARAVYDNFAESSDELEFHKGDIVTVIEQNTGGLEGWWLCALNGRQGIAPGNRLRVIPIVPATTQQTTQQPVVQGSFVNVDEDDEYDVPTHQYPNLNAEDPNEVYDVPVSHNFGSRSMLDQDPEELYDVPPPALQRRGSQENVLTSSPHHRSVTVEQEVYDVPSNLLAPLDVSHIPNEQDPMEIYDVPPDRSGSILASGEPEEVYDVPLSNKLAQLDVSAILEQNEEEDEEYDVPPVRHPSTIPMISVLSQPSQNTSLFEPSSPDIIYDTPTSNRLVESGYKQGSANSSKTNSLRRFSPGNKKYLPKQESEDYVYDVPPQVTRDQPVPHLNQSETESLDTVIRRLSLVDPNDGVQTPKSRSSTGSAFSLIASNSNYSNLTELNLELSSAIDKLIKLKQSLEDSVSALLTHVFEGWRQKENISGKIGVIKDVFETVLKNVVLFLDFARGAMANAFAAYERGLTSSLPRSIITGMHKLLQPLEEDHVMLQAANETLNEACWSLGKLVSEDTATGIPDEVDSFVMTSRAVSDDSRQMAAYIHTNSQYLFKKVENRTHPEAEKRRVLEMVQARPLPAVPSPSRQSIESIKRTPSEEPGLDDYDYVALEEQDNPEITNVAASAIKNISTGNKMRHKEVLQVLEMSNQQHGVPLILTPEVELNVAVEGDHQFTTQEMVDDVPIMVENLVVAVKQFYNAVDNSDPPKTFVALSKKVILCAHELVFFGDILYRKMQHLPMQEIVKGHCTQLCTSLKRTVAATKHAAQQWPSEKTMQEMIDRVTDITMNAHQFRIVLSQCKIR